MGLGTVCIYQGRRLTAANAYLGRRPDNLDVVPNAQVAKVLFDGVRAIGVQTIEGALYNCKYEVVLSDGALNSPQLLMLSGIGPAADLKAHGIEIVCDHAMVGKNLQDHCFSSVGVVVENSEKLSAESQSPSPMGWFKLPGTEDSPECGSIPARVRAHRQKETIPDIEIATVSEYLVQRWGLIDIVQHIPDSLVGHVHHPGTQFVGAMCIVMNQQSQGTVELQSDDPKCPPRIDPVLLRHEFDRRMMIDGLRETKRLLFTPVFLEKMVKSYFRTMILTRRFG